MNEAELKNLWLATSQKMEAQFVINIKNTEDLARMKTYHLLGSMKPIKIFTILAGLLWVGGGIGILTPVYLFAFEKANKYFLFSATIQIVLSAIALFVYVYQLVLIYQTEITEPILKTQERLARLRISTLWVTRILFLQLPVWTTFWWYGNPFTDWTLLQLLVSFSVTMLFAAVAVWLFFNIKFENRNKKWFRLIFDGREWSPLLKSMEILEEVEAYKTGK
ncbi:MAG TPA: hypothetical protein PKV73_02680 [Agriterribacter sp.]|nr:hypothetical protein [Agriterribacter sp.]